MPLTSNATCPASASVLLHAAAVLLTSDARTTLPLKRHCRYPRPSDTAENPLPCTVTDVPPSAAPRSGHTDDTASAGWYVNATPLALNCCPFMLTSTTRMPEPLCAGVAHSTSLLSTYRATTVALLSSNRQRSVVASRK